MAPARAVLLPGSGSDAEFLRRAFGGPLAAAGIALTPVVPRPGPAVVEGYRHALDELVDAALAAGEPVLVGGVSLGAQVAASWAAARAPHRRPAGLLLALPAWRGAPDAAPAARAARLTAEQVRRTGVDGALAAARAGGAPGWLVAELARAWAGYGTGLADALDAAAATPGPDLTELAALALPTGLAALRDDPVHPHAEATAWARALPIAALRSTSLAAFGADPAELGRVALAAWQTAAAPVS